jgi:hypothetical protein
MTDGQAGAWDHRNDEGALSKPTAYTRIRITGEPLPKPTEAKSFVDALNQEMQACRDDMQAALARDLGPFWTPLPRPPLKWRVRAWRRLKYAARARTQPARAWLARKLYDYVEHEDRW